MHRKGQRSHERSVDNTDFNRKGSMVGKSCLHPYERAHKLIASTKALLYTFCYSPFCQCLLNRGPEIIELPPVGGPHGSHTIGSLIQRTMKSHFIRHLAWDELHIWIFVCCHRMLLLDYGFYFSDSQSLRHQDPSLLPQWVANPLAGMIRYFWRPLLGHADTATHSIGLRMAHRSAQKLLPVKLEVASKNWK